MVVTRRRLAGFAVLAGIVCALLWASHWPQTMAIQWAVRASTGAEIDLFLTGTLGNIVIEEMTVYPDEGARRENHPLFTASGITLAYRLWGNGGRFLPALNVEQLDLYPDALDPESPNYQFLVDFLAPDPDRKPSMAFVPQEILIDTVRTQGRWQVYEGDSGTLAVEIRCNSLDDIQIAVTGKDVRVEVAEGDAQAASVGDVKWTALYTGEELEMTYAAAFPDWVDARGSLNFLVTDGTPTQWSWKSDATSLYAAALDAAAVLGLSFPGGFESVTLSDAELRGFLGESVTLGGSMNVMCRGLNVARGDAVLFQGDVDGKILFVEGDELKGNAELDFGDGRLLHADLKGDAAAFEGGVEWTDWSKDGVLHMTPADFRSSIDSLQFDTLSGNADVVWADTGYVATAHIRSASDSGQEPVYLDLDLTGDTRGGRWPEGYLDARLGKGVMQGAGFYREDGDYGADMVLENIRLKPWVYVLAGVDLPDVFEGKVKGSVHAVMANEDDALRITPELTLYDLKYEDFYMQEAAIGGLATVSSDRRAWTVSTLSLADQRGEFSTTLSDWRGSFDDGSYAGEFSGELDTTLVAEPMRWWDLSGTLSFSGRVDDAGDHTKVAVTASSGDLGYGDWLLPYGSELVAQGNVHVDRISDVLTSDEMTVRVGDGTKLALTEVRVNLDSSDATARYALESDLALAVEMGYAAEILGKATVTGGVEYAEETRRATYQVVAEVDTVSLPDNAATVTGVKVQLDGTYDDGALDGKGDLRVRVISAAGATMHDVAGGVRMSGTKMSAPEIHGKLFDGTFTGSAEVGVLEETLPIWLNGSYEDIDLAKLTEEVQPPKTQLTGLASGTLSASYSTEGLEGFVLNAESQTGFTMNRSLVEEIMQTQTLLGGIGAKKAEKAVAKFLGDAAQRPFDSATLYVYLVESVINGIAELRSAKTRDYNGLNLTINLDIDKAALAQSLKLLEESNMNDVEF